MNSFKRAGRFLFVALIAATVAQAAFGMVFAAAPGLPPGSTVEKDGNIIAFPPEPYRKVSYAPQAAYLYGTSQTSNVTLLGAANSIDKAFNNSAANGTDKWSDMAYSWTFNVIQDTSVNSTNTTAEFRFYVAGWTNDPFVVEAYNGTWNTLETFNTGNPPPTTNLTTKSYNVQSTYGNTTLLDNAQLRIRGTGRSGGADTYTIYVDGVRIIAYGEPLPGNLNQRHFRMGFDTSLSSPRWITPCDDEPINIYRGENIRIAIQVVNSGGLDKSWVPRLDWSTSNSSGFAAVPNTSGTDPFFVSDSTNITNGDVISTAVFGCDEDDATAQNGTAYDTLNPATSNLTLNGTSYTEIQFSIQPNDYASYNTTYYFRLSDNGTAFSSYSQVASLTIQLQPSSSDPHNTYTADTDKCAGCHRIHTGRFSRMRKVAGEESLCLSCHDGTGASTNIAKNFTMNYTHPISSTSGLHTPGEFASANFSGSNRHVECEDCHKPHSRYPGPSQNYTNTASPIIKYSSGISVTNGAANTTPTYNFTTSINYEYELCFKCHTAWSNVTSRPYTSFNVSYNLTDQGVEFNPANRATHPIEGLGALQSINPNFLQTFANGYTPDSLVKCGDCHGSSNVSDATGVHGSNNKAILAGSAEHPQIVCFKCHRYDVYWGNSPPNASLSRTNHPINGSMFTENASDVNRLTGIYCMDCHGGGTPGGMHGTHAGIGPGGGADPLGERFLNGASITGITHGVFGVTNGECWTKADPDDVNRCTANHGSKSYTPNYDY